KDSWRERREAMDLLGQCGAAARPWLPALVRSLDPASFDTPFAILDLAPLLRPEDGDLLPALRERLDLKSGSHLRLAEVLFRLGRQGEAVAQAVRCLDSESEFEWVRAARWLGERGRGARAAEPALRRALEQASGGVHARL